MSINQLNDKEERLKIIDVILRNIAASFDINKINNEPGLFSGYSGISLFFSAYNSIYHSQLYKNQTNQFIEKAFEEINNGFNSYTFYSGISGILWATLYLIDHNDLSINNFRTVKLFDDYLYQRMILDFENNNLDFLHGAIGVAFYFCYYSAAKLTIDCE